MKGVNANLYTSMAVCRNFAKGRTKLEYLKRAASSVRGNTGKQCLKISLLNGTPEVQMPPLTPTLN